MYLHKQLNTYVQYSCQFPFPSLSSVIQSAENINYINIPVSPCALIPYKFKLHCYKYIICSWSFSVFSICNRFLLVSFLILLPDFSLIGILLTTTHSFYWCSFNYLFILFDTLVHCSFYVGGTHFLLTNITFFS